MPRNLSGLGSSRRNILGLRILLALAILSLILAQTIFRSTPMRDGCIGFGIGILGAALIGSFIDRKSPLRNRDSGVDEFPLTR